VGEGAGEKEGVPMSLQGVYACLMGMGGLSMERYVVYAGLKRCGYVVLRAPTWAVEDGDVEEDFRRDLRRAGHEEEQRYWGLGLFARIFRSLLTRRSNDPPPIGPLVMPGLYRSYSKLCVLPCQLVLTIAPCRRHISPAVHHPVS